MDIYINNKVYVGVKKPKQCPKKAAKLNQDYIFSYQRYPVIGSHKWTNGQDVAGQYKLENNIVYPLN